MFHELYGTPAVILRPFMAYGPRQHKDKIVPHVILSLLKESVQNLASGKWEADWIYVDDVIDGFVLAASRPGIDGRTIDLGVWDVNFDLRSREETRQAGQPGNRAVVRRPGRPALARDSHRGHELIQGQPWLGAGGPLWSRVWQGRSNGIVISSTR